MTVLVDRCIATTFLIALLTLAACGGGDPAAPVVPPVTITTVSVSPPTNTMVVGESASLTTAVGTSDGTNTTALSPVWTSSAPAIVTVSPTGVATGVSAGSAIVSATIGGKTGTASVTVLSVSALNIAPTTAALVEGEFRDLTAMATLSNGTSSVRAATWTSSAPTVASVTGTGRVTALAVGTSTISASVAGVTASAAITVARRAAAVSLNVSARSLVSGESITLVPIVKFSDSTVASGKTITWASSAPTVASVNSAGVVSAVGNGSTDITATVDGRTATAVIIVRAPATTVLTTAAATSASIGPTGGSLTTAAGGITYRLDVPAGALPTTVLIRMTPIATIGNLPLTGGLVAAVDLQPSGLKFAKAAILRIGVSAPPRNGLTLAGFSMNDNGTKTTREFAAARATEVLVPVPHFTAAGAAFGTTQDVESMSPPLTRNAIAETFAQRFASVASGGSSSGGPAMLLALIGWFDNGVLPQLQAATTDDALVAALTEYDIWANQTFGIFGTIPLSSNDPALQSRRLQYSTALGPKLEDAIRQNNQVCRAQQSLTAMQNVLFWQAQAESNGLAVGLLSRASVLASLCAQVALISKAYPDPVQSNFPNDLDAVFGVQFGGSGTATPQAVSVSFSSSEVGVTFAKSSPANSDAQGRFTVAVTAQGNVTYQVTLLACLAVPGATDVCGQHRVSSTSLDVSGNYTGRFSSTIQTPGGTNFPVNVPLNVRLTQSQNGVTGTYEVMQFNGPRGSVSATLVGQQLLNFTLNQFVPCSGTLTGSANFNLTTRTVQSTYSGADCTGTHSNGQSTLTPGTITLSDFTGAWTRQLHPSGFPLQLWRIAQNGTQVRLTFSTFDAANNQMQCRARFSGTVTAGSEVFAATLSANLGGFTDFASNARATWSPDLSRQRGAIINLTNASSFSGQAAWFLTGNVPPGCDP